LLKRLTSFVEKYNFGAELLTAEYW